MAINAKNESAPRELIEAGNYPARCYQMIEVGTVKESYMGVDKVLPKIRIGWELPTELKVFKEENGEQPLVISKEFTLSMFDKSNLRNVLKSWRGKDFSEEEAKCFDVTKLIGVPCMLNIIHKPSKDGSKMYQEIGSISPMPKSMKCPDQINPSFVLSYDDWDQIKFDSLPDFIKTKMQGSMEYTAMKNPHEKEVDVVNTLSSEGEIDDGLDLPF